jgi:ApbE superfamily uncharacterized protein (UPF0280 family)
MADKSYPKSHYVERTYREAGAPNLEKFRICVGESDLLILASRDCRSEIQRLLKNYRRQLKQYLDDYPLFGKTLTPWPADPAAPEIVSRMIRAAARAGVGPMAAVAGAVAGMIGDNLTVAASPDLIIENGGDLYLRSGTARVIAVYAGQSAFSQKIGLLIPPTPNGVGVCTSAGTIGPSLSFGRADAVVIVAPDVALADAVATATANLVQTAVDFPAATAFARSVTGISGILIIKADHMTAWGQVELVPITRRS